MPVGKLDWDDSSIEHIARHHLTHEEVELAFYSSQRIG
jgi:hypothetical protein